MCACAWWYSSLVLHLWQTRGAVREKKESDGERQRARKGQRERERQPACDGCAASARRRLLLRWWTRFRKCRGLHRDFVRRTMDRQDHAHPRNDARRLPRRRHRCRSHQIGWVEPSISFYQPRDPLSPIRGKLSEDHFRCTCREFVSISRRSLLKVPAKKRAKDRGMSRDFSSYFSRTSIVLLTVEFFRTSLVCIFFLVFVLLMSKLFVYTF